MVLGYVFDFVVWVLVFSCSLYVVVFIFKFSNMLFVELLDVF